MRAATIAFVALASVPVIAQAATSRARYLMGTVCAIAATDEHDAERAFAEAERVEAMLSTWRNDSELSRVNAGAPPSPELQELLATTLRWSRETGGAFNPLIAPLLRAWHVREGITAVPPRAALDDAVAKANLGNATLAPFALRNGAAFEEGAFGKGYALDRMLAATRSTAVLIDFGGQLAIRGTFDVSIANPENRDEPVLAFSMTDGSLSTSSGSEKTFTVGGARFSHILDPRSGEALPPRGSVSVLADDALTADILSTALYVLGEGDGLAWANGRGIAAIFIDSDHQIRLSAAARERVRGLRLRNRQFRLKD